MNALAELFAKQQEIRRLTRLKDALVAAHEEHLRTGDYGPLGMAAQDALLRYERDS